MRLAHIALAMMVVAIWGFNFVVIKVGLKEVPPIFLCALRFFFAAFPAIFFIKRPAVPLRMVIGFGLVMFALQFTLLFSGMHAGTTAGLASLILQVHVFFTVLLAVVFLAEKPSIWQIAGALVSFSGLGLVAAHLGGEISAHGLMLIVAAAASWGLGNLIAKKLGTIDMLALVVWGSLVAWPPLLVLSYILEQSRWSAGVVSHISWITIGAIGYIVYPVTLLGFAVWSWLLSRYPAATVAPFTLLVPVFGFTASALTLGEPLSHWKVNAAGLIVSGLCINLFGPRIGARIRPT
ncbi:EamA family transporter [Geobacter sp. SVR]|uniref:EamA family transporter n=1 Tax=Geobacter sp. SVR TaxID=2495594 RepID=UPI00143EF92A|nr:EamA family transporter [Geobacter sp. SVR]BCS54339.1 O-acetylserine/cysteine exporter [Geobacter sp. SVR]GCF85802.1 O-acetylserine/cysteine exporter [Geobacter sp. SVR]